MEIAVIGLGKLGLCTAACFAARGHRVHGVDRNPALIEPLRQGRNPLAETGLTELLSQAGPNLTVGYDLAAAVRTAQVSLIIVPTPSNPAGDFSNRYIEAVLREIGPALRDHPTFHVVDVVSTVMPGSSEKTFLPLLENLSERIGGRDFGLVYNPEFIALGSVIRNFLNPDMVLIGASDPRSAEIVTQLYLSTCENQPSVARMSLVNAEITKISVNCFVTAKISFVNELTAICELVSGADVDAVTTAMGADTRIGPKYLTGGLGFGGPCFPRDNLAFQHFARSFGHEPGLGTEVVAVNNRVVDRLTNRIVRVTPEGETVALLGLSYKPWTHIVEESQAFMVAERLIRAGYRCHLHDPQALPEARARLGETVVAADDPYLAMSGARTVVLMTNWPQWADLDWERAATLVSPGAHLIDSWRTFRDRPPTGFHYQALGLGPISESSPDQGRYLE